MSEASAAVDATLGWPGLDAVVLVTVAGASYARQLPRLVRELAAQYDHGVIVTASRPNLLLSESLSRAGVDLERITVVDCVSSMTGVPPEPRPRVHHVESPTMLEKMALRSEQAVRRLPGRSFVVVDSLSALAVFNGPQAVAELVHGFASRLRLLGAGAAFVFVERQAPPELADRVLPSVDGVLHL